MSRFEDHDCGLRDPEEDVVKRFIDTGFFISFRRKFRSWCIISRSHPETRRYFKSNAARREEEIRHLVTNLHMIHPFSKLNMYWEFFMLCLFVTIYLFTAIDASIGVTRHGDNLYMIKCVLDMFHVVDIIKLFFTGYYDEYKSKVILKSSKVARKYTLIFFFLDIFSCTYSFVYPLRYFIGMSYTTLFPVRIFNRLKIARVPRCLTTLELFQQFMGYSSYLFRGIRVVFIFLVVTLWVFSINFFVTNYIAVFVTNSARDASELSILDNFYEATSMFLCVSFDKYKVASVLEYVNAITFLCVGVILQMFMYAQLLQVWIKYQSSENKHHSLQQEFKEYVKYKKLPVTLRGHFFSYFQFKFHKDFFKESDIENVLSPFLKEEILMHVTRSHVEKVEFFRHIPERILLNIMVRLKTEIFLPGDVIVSAGRTGSSMFFIYHGTVAVYTPKGKEICHLEDGAHFGEVALILGETRVATVVAVTHCELFILRRSDFLTVTQSFTEIRDLLAAQAVERLVKAIEL